MSDGEVSRFRRLAKEKQDWVIIGQVAAVVGALVLIRILTEHLDPTQYGQLSLGLTVAGLVNQTILGGLSAGIGRLYSVAVEKQNLQAYVYDSARLLGYATLAVMAIEFYS